MCSSDLLGKVRRIDTKGETTVSYIPILLPNLRGYEAEILAAWQKLDPADHDRRARYLEALSMIAADRNDPAVKKPIEDLLRAIALDPKQLSQLRVQALQALLMKTITIDDAMAIKRHLASSKPEAQETPGMRAYLKDFLFEFF